MKFIPLQQYILLYMIAKELPKFPIEMPFLKVSIETRIIKIQQLSCTQKIPTENDKQEDFTNIAFDLLQSHPT